MIKKMSIVFLIALLINADCSFADQESTPYTFFVRNRTKQYDLKAYYFTITNPNKVLNFDSKEQLIIEKGKEKKSFHILWNHDFAAYVTISVDIKKPDSNDPEVASCIYTIDFPYEQKSKPFISRAMYDGPSNLTLYCEVKNDNDHFVFTVRED